MITDEQLLGSGKGISDKKYMLVRVELATLGRVCNEPEAPLPTLTKEKAQERVYSLLQLAWELAEDARIGVAMLCGLEAQAFGRIIPLEVPEEIREELKADLIEILAVGKERKSLTPQ